MSIIEWLVENMGRLKKTGVDSPRRDCLVLLEDTLGKDRAWVISHPEYRLKLDTLKNLNKLIKQRVKREPLAYIRGKAWFYGRFFQVSPDVMIPRPESESFIDIAKALKPDLIIDVGTGSGCLAVTSKLELPKAEVIAVDNNENALKVARQNAHQHKVNVEFTTSDILTSVKVLRFLDDRSKNATLLMVNLPYVPSKLVTGPEILYEPKHALFSGEDGLDHYRKFWAQVSNLSSKPQHILTESLKKQHIKMSKLAERSGYRLKNTTALVQHFERTA